MSDLGPINGNPFIKYQTQNTSTTGIQPTGQQNDGQPQQSAAPQQTPVSANDVLNFMANSGSLNIIQKNTNQNLQPQDSSSSANVPTTNISLSQTFNVTPEEAQRISASVNECINKLFETEGSVSNEFPGIPKSLAQNVAAILVWNQT